MKNNEIPFDKWVEIPDGELSKKGRTQFVFRPSNYSGPLAKDGYIRKEAVMRQDPEHVEMIWLTKDEAKIMWPDK